MTQFLGLKYFYFKYKNVVVKRFVSVSQISHETYGITFYKIVNVLYWH
jgi:hypothetical protein